jgi:hypothetical protein
MQSSANRWWFPIICFFRKEATSKGSVLESRPARRLGRNGQLRIVFHQLVPPNGIQQTIPASLEGVAVAKGEHLSLDSEGGAQVTTPRTRYLTTAISVALASSSIGTTTAMQASVERRRRRWQGRSQRSFRISLFRHNHWSVGALTGRGLGFRLLWRGDVGLLPLLARGRDVNYPKTCRC